MFEDDSKRYERICNGARLKVPQLLQTRQMLLFLRALDYSTPEIMKTRWDIYNVRIDNLKEPIWSINLK